MLVRGKRKHKVTHVIGAALATQARALLSPGLCFPRGRALLETLLRAGMRKGQFYGRQFAVNGLSSSKDTAIHLPQLRQ